MSSRSTTRRAAAPAPQTLAEKLLANEHERHAARLACIKRMQARLALLDAFMPALNAAGISLHSDDITDWGTKSLYLGSGLLDHKRNAKLANVLLAEGMRVDARKEYDYGTQDVRLELVKGRLRVSISIHGSAKHLLEVPACA